MSHTLPLEPIERASVDELRALQLQRLRWSLRHAYDNSTVYRRKFDEAGVHPDDCRSLADLAKFPFTTKADLRDSYPFGMFAVPRDQVVRGMRLAVPPANPPWWVTPHATSTPGRPWWRAASVREVHGVATWCM